MGMDKNPSKGGFESKDAPEHLTEGCKDSTSTFSSGPEPGHGEVGNNAPQPSYTPDYDGK